MIVTPALADANNGNWQTASRWRSMLASHGNVRIARTWPDRHAEGDGVMLALHARRSAGAIAAWAAAHGPRGLAVVLTGTDLYGAESGDPAIARSLAAAQALVVLQELGLEALPAGVRAKGRVIFQSTPARREADKTRSHLRAIVVGHLRAVKSPGTVFAAARLLRDAPGILIDHVGDALDAGLGQAARATASECPGYRWHGGLPHEATRRRIQRAHVLVHPSIAEGGAHVVMEAIRCGTPVLASRIPGNVGMLGRDYAGCFPVGDAAALARMLERCRDDLASGSRESLLARLRAQCRRRAPLFAPERERAALLRLVRELG